MNVKISHPEKVLFPADGITKQDLVEYYLSVAELMLPHLRDRPLSMQRYPDGIDGQGFMQKDASKYFPDWIPRFRVAKKGGFTNYVLCNEVDTLVYLTNQNTITAHVWTSTASGFDRPDQMIFDLDPSDDDFASVRRAARQLKKLLEETGVTSSVKTTGSRGLHVVVFLDGTSTTEQVICTAADIATELVARDPSRLTTEFSKADRKGRLYVDTARNAFAQTIVAPYTVRPLPGAPVATPISWDELGRVHPQKFTLRNLPRRLARLGDVWPG